MRPPSGRIAQNEKAHRGFFIQLLFHCLFDLINRILYGHDFLCFIIVDLDIELFLNSHDDLENIQ